VSTPATCPRVNTSANQRIQPGGTRPGGTPCPAFRGPWDKAIDYLRTLGQDLAVCSEASVGYGPLHDASPERPAFRRQVAPAWWRWRTGW